MYRVAHIFASAPADGLASVSIAAVVGARAAMDDVFIFSDASVATAAVSATCYCTCIPATYWPAQRATLHEQASTNGSLLY